MPFLQQIRYTMKSVKVTVTFEVDTDKLPELLDMLGDTDTSQLLTEQTVESTQTSTTTEAMQTTEAQSPSPVAEEPKEEIVKDFQPKSPEERLQSPKSEPAEQETPAEPEQTSEEEVEAQAEKDFYELFNINK